jgi:hypothetical protein
MPANKLLNPVVVQVLKMIRNFLAMWDPDPKYPFRIRSIRRELVSTIKNGPATSCPNILLMPANKLIKSGCCSAAKIIRNFLTTFVESGSEIFVPDSVQFGHELVLSIKNGPDLD